VSTDAFALASGPARARRVSPVISTFCVISHRCHEHGDRNPQSSQPPPHELIVLVVEVNRPGFDGGSILEWRI
jgi:hypothetical protein